MNQYLEILLSGENFFLLPQKALYRPALKQLILADLHLGKSTHFRKKGIPLPANTFLKDIDLLHHLLSKWQPETVLFLGDLFHSDYNREWLWLKSVLQHYPSTQFILVEGNHDILESGHYELPNFLTAEIIEEEYLLFSHHPLAQPGKLNICGHVHPGLRLSGRARESLTLPCFYLGGQHLILPAFGYHTGLQIIDDQGQFFAVTGSKVVAVNR
jgi:uncharacterized protein